MQDTQHKLLFEVEDMTKDEMKHDELLELGKEISARRKIIVDAYKATHTLPSRGRIITPELTELEAEEKRRFIEICEKYKT
nr:MAG TPA: hypothetical protein [Caudoviricetes sp.]